MTSIHVDVGRFVSSLGKAVFGVGTRNEYVIKRWQSGEPEGKYFYCVRGKFFGKTEEVAEFSMLVVATPILSMPTLTCVQSGFRSKVAVYDGGDNWQTLS